MLAHCIVCNSINNTLLVQKSIVQSIVQLLFGGGGVPSAFPHLPTSVYTAERTVIQRTINRYTLEPFNSLVAQPLPNYCSLLHFV